MAVEVTDNTEKILKDLEIKSNMFLRSASDSIVEISTPKTPKDTGDLRRYVRKQVLGLKAKIEWKQPYAAIQETRQFRNYTTPGTGPKFAESAVKQVVDDTDKIARKIGFK